MNTVPITKKLIAFGSKEIYLPKFTIAFVRTPDASPYHARFLVPLDFSKYDLRDYLYHAYNVKAFNIRSFVKQMPVRDTAARPRTWFRPESKKYMTVEMEEPFVWPKTPQDLEPWGGIDEEKEQESTIAKISGQLEKEEQREAAQKLRKQVEKLFTKEEEKPVDDAIEQKQKQNRPLNAEEKEKKDEQSRRMRKLKEMTTLELWEERRTGKIVHGDDRSQYVIKA